MSVEVLTSAACRLAEGPIWHADHACVYWTDIMAGTLHRYDPATGTATAVWHGPQLGGYTIQEDGSMLLFLERGAIHHFRDGIATPMIDEIEIETSSRFNDVAADPAGRVFCGTMSSDRGPGRLYRLDLDGTLTVVLENIGCSNGIGFSPDHRTMYYIDSTARRVYAFDYSEATGELTNQRDVYVHPENAGVPDGMTVDAKGDLWVALWDGQAVLHLRPDGSEIERFAMPAKKVTCPTFGGPDLAHLYVTTAGGDKKDEEGDGAGELLRMNPGVGGVAEFRSRISFPRMQG